MVASLVPVTATTPNVPAMPVPVSRILYREFLLGSTGSMSRTHEMRGEGLPTAEHCSTALWPISTTLVLGACVICGKPAGSLSAETKKIHFFLHVLIPRHWRFDVHIVKVKVNFHPEDQSLGRHNSTLVLTSVLDGGG